MGLMLCRRVGLFWQRAGLHLYSLEALAALLTAHPWPPQREPRVLVWLNGWVMSEWTIW